MDSEKLRTRLGTNIAMFRKQAGLTQAELAEKINYSDKAVSKWERGESIPDITTLVALADEFGTSLDDLLGRETAQQKQETAAPPVNRRRRKQTTVIKLSSLLVWFIALLVYVVLSSVGVPKSWVAFVYAVPVNAIVLLVLRSSFKRFNWNLILISLIVWGCLMSIYITLLVFAHANVWRIFLLGLLGQAAVLLWFHMIKKDEIDE